MKKTLIAIASVAVLACASIGAPTPAQARGGAVVGGLLGGLAVGAIIGSAAAARPYAPPPAVVYEEPEPVYVAPRPAMCVEPREVWSNRYQGYVTRNVHVPCY